MSKDTRVRLTRGEADLVICLIEAVLGTYSSSTDHHKALNATGRATLTYIKNKLTPKSETLDQSNKEEGR